MSLLHGRRGPAPLRPDDAVRAAEQVQHGGARADRRRRRDHAVELPDRDPGVEARARRSSAATPSSSSRRRTRRCSRSASSSCSPRRDCPTASSTSSTASARRRRGARRAIPTCASSRSPARARPASRHEGGGRQAQARPPRARRQERDHRHGRRRPRSRGRGDRLVGVRHVRPALHRRVARDRARTVYDALQKRLVARGGAAAPRPGLGGRDGRRPGDQPRAIEKIHPYTQIGTDEGAQLLTGGETRPTATSAKGSSTDRPSSRRRPADAHRAGGDLRADDA